MTDKNIQRTISVLRVVAKLPLWFLYLISDLGYFVVCYLVRYRNKVIKKNLKASFPDKTDKALRRIQKSFYRQLCDTAVESFKLLIMKIQVLIKRVDVQG
ncbi:MAG: hypothetical protein KBT12_06850 [Bacteroidales bacterium]|nr:hypothetical protein [Candidatus Physcousia equi]